MENTPIHLFLFAHPPYDVLFEKNQKEFSFSLAQRKEVKETSTSSWTLPLYGEGNWKSRIRVDFQTSLRLALKLSPLRVEPAHAR